MQTPLILTPQSTEFSSTNFPQLFQSIHATGSRWSLAFNALELGETAIWTAVVPQGWTEIANVVIPYYMDSETFGRAIFSVNVITSAGAIETNTGADTDTADYVEQTIVLANPISVAAGDLLRISLTRAVADTEDTAFGDAYVLGVKINGA